MPEHYDVIIIGSGAGGGTLAHRLAPSGKRVLVLERGGYLPREPENWDSREVFGRGRYTTDEQWLDKHGEAFTPHAQYFVGGNTKVYGAILFRLRERDFERVEHYGGISPAWPISYADLESYYAEAERLYLVHGKAGEDPTEPPRSGPFPYPAVSHEPRIQRLHEDFERTGHRPFHLPVGIDLDESDPEAGRCAKFDGFPCLTDRQGRCARAVRAPRARARQRDARDALEGRAARDRPLGAMRDARGRRPGGRRAELQRRSRRRLVWRRQLGRAAAALGLRAPPEWARQLLRRRRAPLHGAPQLGRRRDLQGAEPDEVPEDARRQRLLLGR